MELIEHIEPHRTHRTHRTTSNPSNTSNNIEHIERIKTIEPNLIRGSSRVTRSNRRLCSAFDMLAIGEKRATCNMPCVKKCYFPHAGDVLTEHLRSSSVSNLIKAVTAFFIFYGSLIGACYDSKCHKAIVAQDRITQKTCELMVCNLVPRARVPLTSGREAHGLWSNPKPEPGNPGSGLILRVRQRLWLK